MFKVLALFGFGRRYPEEQFCEISLNLDQSFRRSCHLKQTFNGQTDAHQAKTNHNSLPFSLLLT